MKKLLLLLVPVLMLACSKDYTEDINTINGRLDKLEQETIPSIDEQIAAINTTLGNLDAMDKELKGYIDGLQATADNLQEQINATNTNIDEVKTALQGEISTAKAAVLAELEALETELKNELAQINATIATLQAKDTELEGKIAELKTYVDTELGKTTDWVAATFATLEQYNSLVSEVATIKEQIKAINESITNLETKLTTKINEDIATAVSTLNADIQQKVSDITTAYTNAITKAKSDITAAYTIAIQTAINALDASLKSWVGQQLSNYYTIAEVEAKISALQIVIAENNTTLQEELNTLKTQLKTAATEITAAYKKAIEEAITTNNGVINTKIANEIATVNSRIDSEVATINAKIANIEARLDNVEAKLEELLARIQSVSYIPQYEDGKATVKYAEGVSRVTLDFEVSPKNAVAELAKVWEDAVSVKAVYTQTRAVEFIDMPIVKFESDIENGVITVSASGENLSAEFFAGIQGANVRLAISDGNNYIASEYVPIVKDESNSDMDTIPEILSDYQIWYTTTDGNKLFPSYTDPNKFGAILKSNEYKNNKGVLTFDAPVTLIGESAFSDCTSLTGITIPDSVTSIGKNAFSGCTSLTSVTIPDSVTSIENSAFSDCSNLPIIDNIRYADTYAVVVIDKTLSSYTIKDSTRFIGNSTFSGCRSLISITIPDSVTSIGKYAFSSCESLTSVTIPDSVTSIGNNTFSGCTSLTGITIPDSVTSIGERAFSGCTSLTGITIPDSVTSIGGEAFYNCKSLTSATIPDSVTSIGERAFYGCTGEITINCNIPNYSRSVTSEIECDSPFYGSKFKKITFGDSVTSIGQYAFYNCSSLTKVNITDLSAWCKMIFGNSYANPLRYAKNLYLNSELITKLTIPSDITEIKNFAFYGCSSLTSVTIGNDVTSIGERAFYNCSSLTSVTIPDSVSSIGQYAFYNCSSLTSVTIGNNVTSIGESAFYNCSSLTEVYCKPTTPPTAATDDYMPIGCTIYVPTASIEVYKTADGWSVYADYIVGYDF